MQPADIMQTSERTHICPHELWHEIDLHEWNSPPQLCVFPNSEPQTARPASFKLGLPAKESDSGRNP
jgi:hypothetical protein